MRAMLSTQFKFDDFVKVLVGSILIYALLVFLLPLIPNLDVFFEGLHPSAFFLFSYLLQLVVLFLPLWFFVIKVQKPSLKDFGFKKIKLKKGIITVAVAYISYLIVAVAISSLMAANDLSVPGYEAQEAYLPFFGEDALGFTIAILFIVFIAPFLEELFFRGFIYRIFTNKWPVWIGSVLAAAVFALSHFQLNSVIPLFILGLFLNATYQRSGSLWTSMTFHMINNAIAFGFEILIFFNPAILDELEQTVAFLYNTMTLF